nr:lysylphosphatidylglycerol synthase transmembrane domain-containing protein [Streptomyces cavernae]
MSTRLATRPAEERTADDPPEASPAGAAAPTGDEGARGRGSALRKHLGTVAGIAILGVLMWRLGTGVFLDGLRRIDGATVLVALAIGLLTTVCSAWRWCLVARGLNIKLPLGRAVADYYRALFLNAALPGGVVGDVHRAVRHGQDEGSMGRAVRAVVLERTAGQLVLAVIGVAVLVTVDSPVLRQTRELVAVLAVAALGVLAVVAGLRLRRGTPGTSRRHRALRAAAAEIRQTLLSRANAPGVLVSSVIVLAGHLAMFVVAARAAGSAASALEVIPIGLLALIAMGLPLNVGGWGPREGVTAWAFGAAGLGASQGLTVAVIYGVLSLVASLPGIVVLVARWAAGLRSGGPAPKGHRSRFSRREKYSPKDSVNAASSSFPFSADALDGRPMTPESV